MQDALPKDRHFSLAHALAGLISQDGQMVHAASLGMSLLAWFVILPLRHASLTPWLAAAALGVYEPRGLTGIRRERALAETGQPASRGFTHNRTKAFWL